MTGDGSPAAYPFSPASGNDLDARLGQLRESTPVCPIRLPYGDEAAWLVTRYEDVRRVLSDPLFSRAAACGAQVPRMTPEPGSSASILMTDRPEHDRLRRIVTSAFTTRRVNNLRPRITALTEQLLDDVEAAGPPADLVPLLALPLPLLVICELLGVPVEDRTTFRQWVDPIMSSTAYRPEQVRQALDDFSDYVCDLIEERRTRPSGDLLSALIHAHDVDGRLTELELVTFAGTLLIAGHENTANMIGNAVVTLLETPSHWARLSAEPHIVASAVEELLRYLAQGTGVSFARVATGDVTLSGVRIPVGAPVVVSLPAANRDPRVFADPESVNLSRSPNPHLAFGPGIHHCVGSSLARAELQVVLGAMSRRWPRLSLARPAVDLGWKKGLLARAPTQVPVVW
ncbi:cytochrome P450 [Plantactinospora sp. WMMC1484]|uniref:cytochrome P450 n=1 Tax=Plantactinospora sp. WMMC1484 TaxID=3404122 RepID=UPI003BF5DC2A